MLQSNLRFRLCGVLSYTLVVGACTGTIGISTQSGGNGGGQGGGAGPSAGGPCRVAVPMRRLSEVQYRNAVRDLFKGQATLAADFAIPTIGAPASGFTTDPGYNALDLGVARELNDSAITVALSVVDKLATLVPCAANANEACAQTFIDTYGRRAFRRPLQDAEKATFLKAFKLGTGADAFKDGIAAVVASMLNSPQFIYQTEAGQDAGAKNGVVELTGYEIASRLSLLLWDSIPDDGLLDAAAEGKLKSADGIRDQLDRLLDDTKARSVAVRFVREWSHVTKPMSKTDKAYTDALATAMQTEFDDFVADSFLGKGSTLGTLLTSTAPYKNPTVDSFIKANGGYEGRSGLLTQPAFLAGVAHPSDTSPIQRAVFVRSKLTCETFPAPPNDALSIEAGLPLSATATQRERSVARSKNTRCLGCHNLIDPLGFGFESFDEIGRFRKTNKNGSALDASGDFVDPASPDLAGKFSSVAELGERLSKNSVVHECMARQLFRFNYAKTDESADACSVQGIAAKFADSGLGLRDLMAAVVTADEFRFRRVD